jgi:hypothetical protein
MALLDQQLNKNANLLVSAEFGAKEQEASNTPKSTIRKYKFSFSGLNEEEDNDSVSSNDDRQANALTTNINTFIKSLKHDP